jgi:hypothetical protein
MISCIKNDRYLATSISWEEGGPWTVDLRNKAENYALDRKVNKQRIFANTMRSHMTKAWHETYLITGVLRFTS